MKLEVLISTMNQKDYSLIKKMNIHSDAVVINQCDNNSLTEIYQNPYRIKWINRSERGLSKSRNVAIKNSEADICMISDDDLIYVDNYIERVKTQFVKYPDADIITFQVEGIEEKFKDYHTEARELNYFTSMKVASVEIVFKRDSIIRNNIKFNESFGAGTNYQMGEENIFLTLCLKKRLKLVYVPVKIADLHIGESSWFKGYNSNFFVSKGAQFTAMSELLSVPYILQYIARKYKLFKNEIDVISATRSMFEGRKLYLGKKNSGDLNE
jgi:glycosyltransferase involved in cell wall biosynthesis